jgi:hypothetical protein
MDKQLLKAYIRTIVEEEVTRILPTMLNEAVQQVKQLHESVTPVNRTQPSTDARKFSKNELAQMMGLTYDGETLNATGVVNGASGNPSVEAVINRDYSALMKKMGLS